MFPSCIKSEHRFLTPEKVVILPTKTALKMSSILRIRQLCVVIFFICLTGRFFYVVSDKHIMCEKSTFQLFNSKSQFRERIFLQMIWKIDQYI